MLISFQKSYILCFKQCLIGCINRYSNYVLEIGQISNFEKKNVRGRKSQYIYLVFMNGKQCFKTFLLLVLTVADNFNACSNKIM